MIQQPSTHAKTHKYCARDMLWCVVTRGNTEGVTLTTPKYGTNVMQLKPSWSHVRHPFRIRTKFPTPLLLGLADRHARERTQLHVPCVPPTARDASPLLCARRLPAATRTPTAAQGPYDPPAAPSFDNRNCDQGFLHSRERKER
jgi:hypothetical protein